MKNIYKLIWSSEALNNLKAIVNYLEIRWTKREIIKFSQLLENKITIIIDNPFLFPESIKSKGIRKAVLTKQTTIYYRIIDNEIHLITLYDNRQNPNKLIKK